MKIYGILLLLSLSILSIIGFKLLANTKKIKTENNTSKLLSTNRNCQVADTNIAYTKTKNHIKHFWQANKGKLSIETKKDSLIHFFDNILLPFWYGTPWDFNGNTTNPSKGSVACGYFVTTLLQDAGINLQRVYLAQQSSLVIIHKLISKKYCHNYIDDTYDNFIAKVKAKGKGLYLIGLDFHVGFLLHANDGELYFVHSNYIKRSGVVKELAEESIALKSSKFRYVGFLTNDEAFIKKI